MANEQHLATIRQSVMAWNRWVERHYPVRADLSNAHLQGLNLGDAYLSSSNLSCSNLSFADLSSADLTNANLTGANLKGANLSRAKLTGANFSMARIGYTTFASNDLSSIIGLENVQHIGPSSIGIDTIYLSNGNIPEGFLRACGVPDEFINHTKPLAKKAFDFYSCFISYSSKNQAFVEHLYADLQAKGVRCWFAPEDLKIGEEIRVGIDESIRKHDKLLIILSKESVMSEWVKKEVETAMEKERSQKRIVLFPIRLDNTIMKIETGWAADIRRTRNIGDFRKWKDPDLYQRAFNRLLRDLNAAELV
jgi:uncharacterized protein YjbI with pentapeptide repeats